MDGYHRFHTSSCLFVTLIAISPIRIDVLDDRPIEGGALIGGNCIPIVETPTVIDPRKANLSPTLGVTSPVQGKVKTSEKSVFLPPTSPSQRSGSEQ